eukprot:CAMPEP_0118939002 /NCGR_PEP_ID=MMETSP1169-20130426/27690_1 /TAXON_ID=36882 /ORGANISM="Pyramimonas obovata, Strain CCMP722" /LENGTH=288 /DNA_ID=CAMNT_0006883153 /DNA_START=139 /DNA_END=1001 /DNA_ORIENTATION=-
MGDMMLEDFDDDVPVPEAFVKPKTQNMSEAAPEKLYDAMVLPGGVHPGFAKQSPQVVKQKFSIDQIFLMPMICHSMLKKEDLSGILKPKLRSLPAERLAGLSAEQVGALKSEQLAALTLKQLHALSSDAVKGLSADLRAALATILEIKSAGISVCWWSAEKFKGIAPGLLLALEPEQLASLSLEQISVLPPEFFAGLHPEQVLALRPDQIAALSSAQAQALMTPEVMQSLEAEQMAAVTEDQMAGWTPEARAFFKAVRKVMSTPPEDLQKWDPAKFANVTSLQVQSLA